MDNQKLPPLSLSLSLFRSVFVCEKNIHFHKRNRLFEFILQYRSAACNLKQHDIEVCKFFLVILFISATYY